MTHALAIYPLCIPAGDLGADLDLTGGLCLAAAARAQRSDFHGDDVDGGRMGAGLCAELGSTDLESLVFWARVEYIGIVSGPVTTLLLALAYTGREQWLAPRRLAMLAIVPILTLLLLWTNDLHGLVWSSVQLASGGSFARLDVTYGAWFLVHVAYSYVVMLIGMILVFQAFVRSARPYRSQAAVLVVSWAAPLIGNALYITRISPFPYLDLTPSRLRWPGCCGPGGCFAFICSISCRWRATRSSRACATL